MVFVEINCEEFKNYTIEEQKKLIRMNIKRLIQENKEYKILFNIKEHGRELNINLNNIDDFDRLIKDFNLRTSKIIMSLNKR